VFATEYGLRFVGHVTLAPESRHSNMKRIVLACVTLLAGCANFPTTDYQSFPGAGQPGLDERREARALEQAESNCVSHGKDVEAGRDEGQTVYNCVER
jgi:hypothetical protein